MALSSTHLRAFRTFLEANRRLVDAVEARLAARDLPLSHYDVLVHLSEADGQRLRMQELADSVLLSKSGLSRLVDRLQAAGHVRREPCPDDARGINAVLTPAGLQALQDAVPGHQDDVEELFASQLSRDEAECLTRLLARVRDRAMLD
jgi:DNA-binding MarR family transcriptional regulator